jgi:hypothetical protein
MTEYEAFLNRLCDLVRDDPPLHAAVVSLINSLAEYKCEQALMLHHRRERQQHVTSQQELVQTSAPAQAIARCEVSSTD